MKSGPRVERFRRAIGNLLIMMASLSATLVAIEVLLRLNVISNSYYDRQRVMGEGDTGPRIIILGDSFMAPRDGADSGDDLHAALAQHGVRIRNTAMPGTGPIQYLHNLRDESRRFPPDVVLLSYYVGNDLLDVGCVRPLQERLEPPAVLPAWKRSYTVQFLRERLRAVFPGRGILGSMLSALPPWGWAGATILKPRLIQRPDYQRMRDSGIAAEYIAAAKAGRINPWLADVGVRYPDYYRDALLMRSPCAQRSWQDAQRVLDLILNQAMALRVPVLPVIFPHSLQVDTLHHALFSALNIRVDDEMLHSERPQALLREYHRSRGLEPLDLLTAFRAQAREEPLHWSIDEHLNRRGEEFAATIIARALLAGIEDSGSTTRQDLPTAGIPRIARSRYRRLPEPNTDCVSSDVLLEQSPGAHVTLGVLPK